jgi:hypothetical protein
MSISNYSLVELVWRSKRNNWQPLGQQCWHTNSACFGPCGFEMKVGTFFRIENDYSYLYLLYLLLNTFIELRVQGELWFVRMTFWRPGHSGSCKATETQTQDLLPVGTVQYKDYFCSTIEGFQYWGTSTRYCIHCEPPTTHMSECNTTGRANATDSWCKIILDYNCTGVITRWNPEPIRAEVKEKMVRYDVKLWHTPSSHLVKSMFSMVRYVPYWSTRHRSTYTSFARSNNALKPWLGTFDWLVNK